jgi:hypothetical protein
MVDLFDDTKGPAAPPTNISMPVGQVIQSAPPTAPTKPKFDFSTANKTGSKRVIMIYGDKNTGKTNVLEAFAGNTQDTMAIISMDNQSASIWENFYESTERIQIWDGVKYFIENPSERVKIPESAFNNFNYIIELLNTVIKDKYDWVAIDGLSILAQVAEQVMRYENSLGATQGFSNFNLWKERGYHLRTIHRLLYNLAKKGVIYTTYGEFQIEEVEGGQTVKGKTKPKWFDVIMQETEVIIHTWDTEDKVGNSKYFYKIESSKVPKFLPKTAPVDVTDKKVLLPFGGVQKPAGPAPPNLF